MYLAGKKLIVDTISTASPTKDVQNHCFTLSSEPREQPYAGHKQYLHFALIFLDPPPPPLELTAPDQAPLSTAKSFRLSWPRRLFFFYRNCSISGEFSLVDIHYFFVKQLLNGNVEMSLKKVVNTSVDLSKVLQ